jgi:hypothetical protein
MGCRKWLTPKVFAAIMVRAERFRDWYKTRQTAESF